MSDDYLSLLERLVAGQLPRGWRPAFRAVPRHLFLPELIWENNGDELRPLHRSERPAEWLAHANADEPVITQVEDGRDLKGETPSRISSSATKPSIVAMMLDRLEVRPDHRVLEIGTGTGWNATLLAARLGDDHVVSIEVDPTIAERANKALAHAGYSPTLVTGDGALGYSRAAPYDRIIATAAVQRVPYPWIAQTRPGGRVVTPWGTSYHNGALLSLTVRSDGTAAGKFDGDVAFMWLRDQRTPFGSVEDRVRPEHEYVESISPLHPWEPIGDFDGSFAVGLRVPDCKVTVVPDNDGQDNHFVAYLMDPVGGSWASVHVEPDLIDQVPVRQHGPRRLWDEVEDAHRWWAEAGKPDHTRFGLSVEADRQWVWLDVPEQIAGR
ncbi:MAG: methyltransferase domain-containing protein [Mycobacterium sp.]|nr:methyltransferase domain-containing protein [Mycobacterium sp.]